MDSLIERSLRPVPLTAVALLALASACGGESPPPASGEAEETAGSAEPTDTTTAEQAPAPEPTAPSSAHAVYLETSDADAAEALLLAYHEAGDTAHGYPPTGASGDPAYPRVVAPGAIEGLDTHGVLVALADDESVAAALEEHLTARGYENVRNAVVTVEPEPLRALRVRRTAESEPTIHWVGGLRGSFAREVSDAGWMGTRSRATEDGVLLFVFEDLADDIRLLKLEGGGSAEFPYECPIWTVELPEEAPVTDLEAPLDTAECMEH